jgi:hypothetical protein
MCSIWLVALQISYPEVEGIIFDESWDGENITNNAALVNGVNIQVQ